MTSAVSESSRDVLATAALFAAGAEALQEPWFDQPAAASERRMSSVPPAPLVSVGDFLGDPLADSWLR